MWNHYLYDYKFHFCDNLNKQPLVALLLVDLLCVDSWLGFYLVDIRHVTCDKGPLFYQRV